MKKLAILSVTALCLGFVACDDVEEAPGKPQTNPQEAIFGADELAVTAASASVIDLGKLNAEQQPAQVATIAIDSIPAGNVLKLTMQMSKDDSFDKVVELATEIDENNNVVIDADALQGVYYDNITHSPAEGKVSVRFVANMVNGGQTVRLGGPDYYYGVGTLSIKPFAPERVIEDAYYLIGTASNGTIAGAVKFNHSNINPYDDPAFSVKVDITAAEAAAGWQWAVIPESTFAAGAVTGADQAFGIDPNPVVDPDAEEEPDGMKGVLIPSDASGAFTYGVVDVQGPYLVKFNAQTLEYEISLTIENLYTPGNSNGWSQPASQLLFTSNYADYYGFAHLNGDFKFTSQPNWNGVNFGSADQPGKLSTDGGASNINAPVNSLYWVHANIIALTYELTPITSVGCIGGFNGWGAQEPLQPSADFLTWTGTVHMNEGDEWKFRCNDDWGINLGGSPDELEYDGGNLKCTATGDYVVTLDLNNLPYSCSVVKK